MTRGEGGGGRRVIRMNWILKNGATLKERRIRGGGLHYHCSKKKRIADSFISVGKRRLGWAWALREGKRVET